MDLKLVLVFKSLSLKSYSSISGFIYFTFLPLKCCRLNNKMLHNSNKNSAQNVCEVSHEEILGRGCQSLIFFTFTRDFRDYSCCKII